MPKIRKYVVKQRFLEGLKQEKMLLNSLSEIERISLGKGSQYN